jgi:hypothetical protein
MSSAFFRGSVAAAACAAVLAGAACGRSEDIEPGVATPSVTLSRARVPAGAPVDITYRFDVAQDAKIDGNYKVFVHFLDSEGERMWGDDHEPVPPTSEWKPGQKVEYTRLIWFPVYPYVGEAHVRVGLYTDDGRRLPLNAKTDGRREYDVAAFNLLAQSENIFLIFKDGWNATEAPPDQPGLEWQWTKKEATLAFKNPKQDVLFFFEADGRTDVFNPPQKVAIEINGAVVHTVDMEKDPKLHRLPISAAQLGTGEMVELKLKPDRFFSPAQIAAGQPGHGGDTRELGIRVYHAYIAPK